MNELLKVIPVLLSSAVALVAVGFAWWLGRHQRKAEILFEVKLKAYQSLCAALLDFSKKCGSRKEKAFVRYIAITKAHNAIGEAFFHASLYMPKDLVRDIDGVVYPDEIVKLQDFAAKQGWKDRTLDEVAEAEKAITSDAGFHLIAEEGVGKVVAMLKKDLGVESIKGHAFYPRRRFPLFYEGKTND